MDLWSKGLGRLVLTIGLRERSATTVDDESKQLVMQGTMGKPTYWDWSVNLDEEDVVDFLVFLQRPAPVRYIVRSSQRWQMLRVALVGGALFALRSARYSIFGVPKASPNAGETLSRALTQTAAQRPIEEKQ